MPAEVSAVLLRVLGGGLIIAGIAHAWLPRLLGWTAETHRHSGAVSALVIKLHVWFVGLFLIMIGTVCLIGAPALIGPGIVGRLFLWSCAGIFGLRWAAEIGLVSQAVLQSPVAWRLLHRAALIIWPAVSGMFVLAAVAG